MYRLRIAPAELDRDRGLAGARNAADEPDRRLRHAAKTRQRSRQARGKLVLRLALALALALTVARALTAALARTRLLLVRAREAIACCLVFHSAPPFEDSFDGATPANGRPSARRGAWPRVVIGAGGGNRTRTSTLEGSLANHYNTPALA